MSKLTIISGGQTGVDLAALYASEACSLPISGYVPKYYTNELGPFCIPDRFHPFLRETSTPESAKRTELNIRDADGILTLFLVDPSGSKKESGPSLSKGTQHGIDYAQTLGKREEQMMFVNLGQEPAELEQEKKRVTDWLVDGRISKCAIGGPRESEAFGIEEKATRFLLDVFEQVQKRTL